MHITKGISVSILLFIVLNYSFFARSEICYRCANEFIVMHWGRFLPIQAEDQLIADSVCVEINERSEEVRCTGPCLTLNVTIGEGNRSRVLGVMRDCQKKYFSRDSDNNRRCRNQTIKIRQNLLNAEYCFCLGNYCNGNGDSLERSKDKFQKTPKYTKIRNYQRNGTNIERSVWSVHCLMLIYVVCLKFRPIDLYLSDM